MELWREWATLNAQRPSFVPISTMAGLETGVTSLLIALGMIPIVGVAALFLIRSMIDGDLDVVQGIAAFAVLFLLMAIAIWQPVPIASGAVFVILLSLMAFFPYAVSQMERIEMQEIDTDALDAAYRNVHDRPDNVVARFRLAQALHDHGLPGHAILLAESTLDTISTVIDPVQNRSSRHLYRSEEQSAKQWRRELRDDRVFSSLKCPSCGHLNPPTAIACEQCQKPYLLELARKLKPRARFLGKLVLAWAAIALFLVAAALLGSSLSGVMAMLSILLALGCVGGLIYWLFKPRNILA